MTVLVQGSDLPDFELTWRENGDLVPFSDPHAFVLTVTREGDDTPVLTKGTNIDGADTAPNVTVQFSVNERAALTPGIYSARLKATRQSDGRARIMPFSFRIIA